ncbi:phosphotransferase family protein [Streptomyces sp. ST2-7A]|uniref:phosphotransferase family protein n=1 Tax=Streptomyces sp. ST2-7A TaxID=2907214 RepID=UPI001F24E5C2|nr:phosphotransferase [Streptomyces sp. ST2-7A]MCE7079805.1 aminoglycoside phosphotransferase family protein [Streptomyces sp. ST2-7A]
MRVMWEELPAPVRSAVERRLGGRVAIAEAIEDGLTAAFIARLHTVGGGEVFAKGVPTTDGEGHAAQLREVAAGTLAPAMAPEMLWHLETCGWHVLASMVVAGRYPSLAPGSPDLPLMGDALATGRCHLPAGALPCYAQRWERWGTREELVPLRGGWLVHGDVHRHNALVDSAGHRVWLVDWAAAARGPAWIDIADTGIRLMEEGHDAAAAVRWARTVPAWRTATAEALSAWCEVRCRSWTARIGARDSEPSNARLRAFLAATAA